MSQTAMVLDRAGHATMRLSRLNSVFNIKRNFVRDADIAKCFAKQDHLTYLKLRHWAKSRCGNINAGHQLYGHTIGGDNWVFSTRKEGSNPLWLLKDNELECSSTDYVKVKNDQSPEDGDLVYWSSKMGKNPELSSRLALLLKKQKGKYSHCEFIFINEDVMEVDHIVPRAIGGKDEYKNLQLLHRHCHDVKTKTDLELIKKHNLEIVSSGKKHPNKSEEREVLKMTRVHPSSRVP